MSDLADKILEALTKDVLPPSRDHKKLKMMVFKIDPDLHRSFKVACTQFGKPMAQVLILLLRRFIKEVDNFVPVDGPIVNLKRNKKFKRKDQKERSNEVGNENEV